MKKIVLVSFMLATFLFTGCAQKAPVIPDNNENTTSKINPNDISNNPNIGNTTDNGVNIKQSGTNAAGSVLSANGALPNDGSYNNSSSGLQSVYFGFGDFGIANDMYKAIDKDVSALNGGSAKIRIEGNCDEFGTDEFNYALGLKRAKAVKDALVAKGVPESMFSIISLGESTPICTDTTDECYAKNRRVDLKRE